MHGNLHMNLETTFLNPNLNGNYINVYYDQVEIVVVDIDPHLTKLAAYQAFVSFMFCDWLCRCDLIFFCC